ncbi:hypothetical protein RHGRI_030716 [Rhododendron griersonianum]|uniref:Uncharacterized protein n=1 Tax=Rhododendron griersonianum TaxID=479676 RepID=A0AAV6I9Q6_9ERIC|nr:hypothetical protein RHGRI_030716 [Rhododendron griersonianum]
MVMQMVEEDKNEIGLPSVNYLFPYPICALKKLLAVAGAPYDTLQEFIGIRDSYGLGSLQDFGVKCREVPLAEDGGLDWNVLKGAVTACRGWQA